jgi:hypothetical protein
MIKNKSSENIVQRRYNEGEKINSNKKVAKMVGVLFIIGTAAGIISLPTAGSIVHAPDYLMRLTENNNRVVLGAFFTLIMGISLSMIPVILFPVFKKYNEALALGAVIFRGALEMLTYMGIASCWLLLLTLSQKYVSAGTPEVSDFHLIGAILLDVENKFVNMLDIVFSIGALFIYYLFYKTKLIPTWLSLWGLIGAILYLAYPILFMFGFDFGILQLPLAVQEMIMAGWLIVKGFHSYAYDAMP